MWNTMNSNTRPNSKVFNNFNWVSKNSGKFILVWPSSRYTWYQTLYMLKLWSNNHKMKFFYYCIICCYKDKIVTNKSVLYMNTFFFVTQASSSFVSNLYFCIIYNNLNMRPCFVLLYFKIILLYMNTIVKLSYQFY